MRRKLGCGEFSYTVVTVTRSLDSTARVPRVYIARSIQNGSPITAPSKQLAFKPRPSHPRPRLAVWI